jgi:hypothetical protein
VQNPSAHTWHCFAHHYFAVQEYRSAKEMAFKWLRKAQLPGWQAAAAAAAEVAACGALLARRALTLAGLARVKMAQERCSLNSSSHRMQSVLR